MRSHSAVSRPGALLILCASIGITQTVSAQDNADLAKKLSNPISESYHPNVTGHASGYYPLVSPLLV